MSIVLKETTVYRGGSTAAVLRPEATAVSIGEYEENAAELDIYFEIGASGGGNTALIVRLSENDVDKLGFFVQRMKEKKRAKERAAKFRQLVRLEARLDELAQDLVDKGVL